MSWSVVDIRAAASGETKVAPNSKGSWEHAECGSVVMINASLTSILVDQLPQLVCAKPLSESEEVSTVIHAGAKGVIDAVDSRVPWSLRLCQALTTCEQAENPCVAIIDAPQSHEIKGATDALTRNAHRISKLRGTSSLFLLVGPDKVLYPVQESPHVITNSEEPWREIKDHAEWGCFVTIPAADINALDRLRNAFALLLGQQTMPLSSMTSTALFPGNSTLPRQLFPYMRFSDNVVFGSARVSRTRGISASTKDGKPWSAQVILAGASETETEEMSHLRRLLTSDDISEKGAAYFYLLSNQHKLPEFARRALPAVHSEFSKHGQSAAAPPLLRAVSHSPCL